MIDDELYRDWREGEDPDRAVAMARHALAELLSSSEPIDVKIARLGDIAEPMLDGPGGSPILVFNAAKALARENGFVERSTRVPRDHRLRRRVEIALLQARALHCAGEHRLALRASLAAIAMVEDFAEGHEGLVAKMANRPPNACAECAVRILGIMAAALRRSRVAESSMEFWTMRIVDLVKSYLPDLKDPGKANIYPGTPALIQVMYLLVARGDKADAPLIKALYALDRLARPGDRRALATVPLREVALARYSGEGERVAEQVELASRRLREHPLPRHLIVVRDQGYLEDDEPPKEPA